ncbi:phage scaffolding protein [Planococcus sp. SSTMD024]|uniref:phage scaffolding protein n=1 Tax=Planococcus sp. SSTMD024 TaxID=3242163 RepID=UPI00351ED430
MDLKELLGEELYQQVSAKAGDKKIAVVSDGNWFPKDKFDAVNADNKELKSQLKDRDDQLVELGKKAKDSEELTNEINSLKETNATQAKDYEEKLQAQKFDTILDDKLREVKVRNPKAAKALLEIDQIKLDGDKLLGLDNQLSALKESDAYLFAEEEAQEGLRGRNPHVPPGSEVPSGQKNPWKKDSFNLTEQGRLMREDPTLAQKLQAQA